MTASFAMLCIAGVLLVTLTRQRPTTTQVPATARTASAGQLVALATAIPTPITIPTPTADPTPTTVPTPTIVPTMTPTPTITPTPDRAATAQAGMTATVRAGSVATALAAATMQAQATGTAQVRTGPTATAQAARAVADDQAGRSAIIYSPTKGQLDHNTNTVGGEGKLANVNTAELILEAKFFNPYPASEGAWDYGFAFRYLPNNNQYTLIVRSDQLYYLYFYDSAIQRNQQISAGRIAGLDISSGGANTVTVFIGADSGLLFVNGAYVATLDLSAQLTGGNVAIVTGILTGDKIAGRSTGYEGFTIYAARR